MPATVFIGIMRVTTVFLFGVACLVVAPAWHADGAYWWAPGLAVALGAVPMLFVMYTTRPFVTWIHLSLPASARESQEAALTYARNLPSNAKLHIGTMGLNIQPQRSEVKLTDVGPVKSMFRPVTFGVINPGVARDKWWKQKSLFFYTKEGSGTGKDTRNSVPGAWENVLRHILKT